MVLALWDWDKLADDSVVPSRAAAADVSRRDARLELRDARPRSMRYSRKALAVGAGLLRKPEKTDYGGYRGYFADPDGHVWEVVQAPGFAFTADGRLILPD